MSDTLWHQALYVHEILQARTLEWVAFPFSRGSSQPRHQTQVSRIAGGLFTSWATRETHVIYNPFEILQIIDPVGLSKKVDWSTVDL